MVFCNSVDNVCIGESCSCMIPCGHNPVYSDAKVEEVMVEKPCSICDNDCSFLAGMDGVCLSCFDGLQSLGTGKLVERLVLASREINRLEAELKASKVRGK